MSEKFDLLKTVRQMLTPQEILAPWIFDENCIMLPDVREGLLKIADRIIENTVLGIDGLDVFDITLTGSSSGYFYRQNSDIDIRIEVHNKDCSFLSKDRKHLNMFLSALLFGSIYAQQYKFTFQGRFIDPKISCFQYDFTSIYSIKYNRWIIKPKKDLTSNLSEEEMIDYYEKKKSKILEDIEKLKQKYNGTRLGDALNEYYIDIILRATNLKDYFVFKLLNYEHILKPIGAESIAAYNKAFVLKSEM